MIKKKFKINDVVRHNCTCGQGFCQKTEGKLLRIIDVLHIDEWEYLLRDDKNDRHRWYKESYLEFGNSIKIREKLGIK